MRRIWILGSSNIDYSYRVERLPGKGETVSTQSLSVSAGGKGANQAVAAAYCGASVHFIGAVGQDTDGDRLLAALKSQGVDASHVSVIEGTASGHAIIFVDNDGANMIAIHGGANLEVPLCDPSHVEIRGDDLLVFQLEINLDSIRSHVAFAAQRGARVVLNPSPYQTLPEEVLRNVHLLVANETEASQMGGIAVVDVESARSCGERISRDLGIGSVVITLGPHGAVTVVRGQPAVHFPAYDVSVVDTQGAGDAFLGSLVAKIAQGESLDRATAFANWVANQSVTRHGSTQTSLPGKEDARRVDYDRRRTLG